MRSELKSAVEKMQGCKARWIESVPVKEVFQGEIVWEGVVQVFDLIDHTTAKKCYAWSDPVDDLKKIKYFAVLHKGSVNSPQVAVKAAIIKDYSAKRRS
jgi:hypothetical protein